MTRISNVRKTTKFKRSIKAISPVIATLLMIAIAVVASLVVYAWVTGYIGSTTTKAGKAIQIPSFATRNDPDTTDLHIYVQNVGQCDVQLSSRAKRLCKQRFGNSEQLLTLHPLMATNYLNRPNCRTHRSIT